MNERWFWDDLVLVRSSVSLAKHVHQVEANYLPECRGHGGCLAVKGLHLEHEVSVGWIVPPLAKEIGEILAQNHLHVKILEHPVEQPYVKPEREE
jgi:hypothetical protein